MLRPLPTTAMASLTMLGIVTLAIVTPGCYNEPKLTTPSYLPKELTVDLGGGVKLELVLIPAGEFTMGSPNADAIASPGEKPPHLVRITRPFYMGRYPVTQEQWQAVMKNNPSSNKDPKCPVESVTWDRCHAFLIELNAKVGGQKGKFALPSEAQWEYACRAGTTTRYCFGNSEKDLGDYAWYEANSAERLHPVGEKKPNAWGLYDMHGDVWEWCQDWYDEKYYSYSPTDDPTGPETGSMVVARGAGYNVAVGCRSATRTYNKPGETHGAQGFRVAFSPEDR